MSKKYKATKKTWIIIIAFIVVIAGITLAFFGDIIFSDDSPFKTLFVSDYHDKDHHGPGDNEEGKDQAEAGETTPDAVIATEPAVETNTPEETAENLTEISDTTANETVYYDTPFIPDGGDELVQLVNKVCGVSSDYVPANLQLTKYRATDRAESNQYMVDYAANAMDAMIEGAQAEGYTILVTTAYRSYNFQNVLYTNYVAKDGQAAADKYSARPGTSEHQTGLAADVTSPTVGYKLTNDFGSTPEGQWLEAHAHEYGFIKRYTTEGEPITGYMNEAWHFRYVGVENATYIFEKGITLEEFIAERY